MDKDKNPLGGEVELVVTITDGVVEVDLKSLAAPGTAGMVEVTGDPILIPASLSAGQKFPDSAHTIVLNLGFKITTNVKVIDHQVTAVEDLKVPAGTFTAYKVSQTNVTTVGRKTENLKANTWYSPGIGIVKSEAFDKKGKLQSSQVLHEIR